MPRRTSLSLRWRPAAAATGSRQPTAPESMACWFAASIRAPRSTMSEQRRAHSLPLSGAGALVSGQAVGAVRSAMSGW
eukprot:scaffold1436_cov77-Isochrysis_galbana.AAC.1